MKPVKKIALLHSLCASGKASMTNMIPILSAMGMEVCPLPTILLSTHTGGYGTPAIQKTEPEFIKKCADHYKEQKICFDLVFVGYLGSLEMVDAVRYFIEKFPNAKVILDPIMGDHGNFYMNMNDAFAKAFQTLLPSADVILPNVTELYQLTDGVYQESLSKEVIERIRVFGTKEVLVTSVIESGQFGVTYITRDSDMFVPLEKVDQSCHGTGDVFDAVFLGRYLQGFSVPECINKAHAFVLACLNDFSLENYDEREGLLIEKSLTKLV